MADVLSRLAAIPPRGGGLNDLLAGLAIGVAGVLTGLGWNIPSIERIDRRLFRAINGVPLPALVDGILRAVRPAGTAWALVLTGAAVGLWRPASAITLLAIGLLCSGFERALKLSLARRRPFDVEPDVRLRLGQRPRDPSFPSGDAARAWFLAGALAFGTGLPAPLAALALALAALVSLSRVRGGVHFPSDAWAGSCLGLAMGLAWAWADPQLLRLLGLT
jgi:membrane-associated phospholipid phosphatase